MASVELVQPHDSTWLMPRRRSEIEISLDTMPTIDTGMAYGVTFLPLLDEEVVVLPFADVDAAAAAADDDAGVRLADAQAGIGPRFARGDDADERGARVALGIGAVARVPDVVALERRHIVDRDAGDGRRDAAGELRRVESVIARVPLQPPLTCSQKRSRPTPNGETTPMPVMTMREALMLRL